MCLFLTVVLEFCQFFSGYLKETAFGFITVVIKLVINYHRLSGLNHTHLLSSSFQGLEARHHLTGSSAWVLTRLESKCWLQPRFSSKLIVISRSNFFVMGGLIPSSIFLLSVNNWMLLTHRDLLQFLDIASSSHNMVLGISS